MLYDAKIVQAGCRTKRCLGFAVAPPIRAGVYLWQR